MLARGEHVPKRPAHRIALAVGVERARRGNQLVLDDVIRPRQQELNYHTAGSEGGGVLIQPLAGVQPVVHMRDVLQHRVASIWVVCGHNWDQRSRRVEQQDLRECDSIGRRVASRREDELPQATARRWWRTEWRHRTRWEPRRRCRWWHRRCGRRDAWRRRGCNCIEAAIGG
eukprot:3015613-Prymnesium_polylepis.1